MEKYKCENSSRGCMSTLRDLTTGRVGESSRFLFGFEMKFPSAAIPVVDPHVRLRETRRIINSIDETPRSFRKQSFAKRNSDLCSPGGARTFLIASVDARLRQHLRAMTSRGFLVAATDVECDYRGDGESIGGGRGEARDDAGRGEEGEEEKLVDAAVYERADWLASSSSS